MSAASPERPAYVRWGTISLVALGGAAGTAARTGVTLAVPEVDGFPWAILLVNIVGAFLLGYLYEAVEHGRTGARRGSQLRLLLGTGFCGGFTTYSTFALGVALLVDAGRSDVALVYASGTVLLGGVATFLGIVAGASSRSDHGTEGQAR